MITPELFVKQFSNHKSETNIKFAKVDPDYTTGQPSVIYDSDILEGTLSKSLPYLESYTPAPNDRVMIVRGVIVGKII